MTSLPELWPVALVAGVAAYLVIPAPAAQLRRLSVAPRRPGASLGASGPGARFRLLGGSAVAVVSLLVVPGPGAPVVAAVLGLGAYWLLRFVPARDGRVAASGQLPNALEFLAVALDAGRPVVGAVAAVAEVSPLPTSAVLGRVAAQMVLGRAGPAAWEGLKTDRVWGRVATDVARSEQSGTALAALLRVHAEDARRDASDEALKAARKVGVKSVIPLMACFLPAFILVGVVPIVAGLLRGFFG